MNRGNILIKNASEVVTCSGFKAKTGKEMSDLKIIPDGAVVIEEGIIKAVGKSDKILEGFKEKDYQVIDASGKSVLPGFVDSHTHFVFGGYRAEEFSWRLNGVSYMEIMQRGGGIINTVKATRVASRKELYDEGMKRLNSMLSLGVTTVEGKSGYGLDCKTEIKQLKIMDELDRTHPIDVVKTFLGAHAVPLEYKGEEDKFIDYIITEVLPGVAEKKLAEFCDVFCEN
jgi:imidazolonepropionase